VEWRGGERSSRSGADGDSAVGLIRHDRFDARVQRDSDVLTLSSPPARTPSTPRALQRAPEPSAAPTPADIVWAWRDSRTCALPHGLGKLELEPDERGPIDLDALPGSLIIRWRGGGERLSPRKGGPRRSLKNLLQEAHVPVAERTRLPLLFSTAPDGAQLLAVGDLLIDASVQATSATRRRARLFWTGAQRR
jgi:tRNA(Ile)-lysidine synthetase-like protein